MRKPYVLRRRGRRGLRDKTIAGMLTCEQVECYQRAIRLDQYLAVAYFQQGVSNFLLGDFEEALANFNDTLLYLRGNSMIDYAQLGLLFKLYSCEVLFNRGLCYIYLQQKEAGMQDLSYAVKEKVVEDHNVIDEAIREEAEGYTVFSIPVGVVYRPNEAKVRNLKTKDYLGKARLVAATDRANAFTGFAGAELRKGIGSEAKDDRPTDNISYAATNLVRPGLSSRRQQSEPPVGRNVFPPTPPPENDRPGMGGGGGGGAGTMRSQSVRNGPRPTPARLNIDKAQPSNRYERQGGGMNGSPENDGPRRPMRSASTSGGPQRMYSMRSNMGGPGRRRSNEDDEDGYPDDVFDMYGGNDRGGNSRSSRQQGRRPMGGRGNYIEEEEGSDYDDGSFDEGDFEMVSNNRRPGTNSMGGASRSGSQRAQMRQIRVKVHGPEDARYIMIGAAIEFPDLVDRIRDKFGIRRRFKIKVRDEDGGNNDMITMGDQDDLDTIIMSVRANAKRQRQEIGKMEVSCLLLFSCVDPPFYDTCADCQF